MAWYEKITDNFSRNENPLSTGWTTFTGYNGLRANTNYALPVTSSTQNASIRTDTTLGNDQYAEAVYIFEGYQGVGVRAATNNMYHCTCENSVNTNYIYKVVNGTRTQIGSTFAGQFANQVIRLEAVGTALEFFADGVSKATRTGQSDLASGQASVYSYNGAGLDNFAAGDDVAPVGGVPIFLKQYRHRWGA